MTLQRIHATGSKVISYISIGESEDYRDYWNSSWIGRYPSWLGDLNPYWAGNYKVRYWDPQWQDIIFKRVDKIVLAGYDGIMMDIIDAYAYWANEMGEGPLDLRRKQMVDFVKEISRKAKAKNPAFMIIPQNGPEIAVDYLDAIDGQHKETTWYDDLGNPLVQYDDMVEQIYAMDNLVANGKFVLNVDYAPTQNRRCEIMSFDQDHGYTPAVGPISLDHIENFPTCTPSTQCVYSYGPWMPNCTTGSIYRLIKDKTPKICQGTPNITMSCIPCQSYTFTAWGACQPSGYQYREIAAETPAGCVGDPLTYQPCTYVPSCQYKYGDWGECSLAGIQSRQLTDTWPQGCQGTPNITQRCDFFCATQNSCKSVHGGNTSYNYRCDMLGNANMLSPFLCSCDVLCDPRVNTLSRRSDGAVQLTSCANSSCQNPVFSPDGTRILYNEFKGGFGNGPSALLILDLLSGNVSTITFGEQTAMTSGRVPGSAKG